MRSGFKKAARVAAFVAIAGIGAASSHAAISDPMNNADNFHNPYGGESVINNNNGTVSILRTVANQDAGVDWNPGNAPILILGNENLTITPVTPINGGYYVPTILLFDAAGNYLSEQGAGGDTNSTQPLTINIPSLVPQSEADQAAQYFLRLRMDPSTGTSTGFEFTEIDTTAAVSTPEPASLGLLGLGALAMIRRRRA